MKIAVDTAAGIYVIDFDFQKDIPFAMQEWRGRKLR